MKYCFYIINNLRSYKSRWVWQIQEGLAKHSKKLELTDNIEEAQYIFIIKDDINKFQLRDDQYFIVVSIQDNIICDHQTINHPKVKYILEHTKLLNDPKKLLTIDDNRAKYLLKFNGTVQEQIFDNYDKKVLLILNTSYHYNVIFQNTIIPLKNRKYDLVFVGTTEYNIKEITKHRTDIIDKIEEFCKKYNYTCYTYPAKLKVDKYYNLLKETRFFVSPYGYGEFSLKDFECVCFGCHVIKPKIYFDYYPNYCHNFDDFELDFSNFDEKMLYLLSNLDLVQDKVEQNRKLFLEHDLENEIKQLDEFF